MPASMWRSRKVVLALSFLLSTPIASAPNLPEPPDGMSWTRIEEIHASFLLPDKWHLSSKADGGTLAYFISLEKVKKGGRFETGLTINVFKNAKDKDAVAYAEAFTASAAKHYEFVDGWKFTVSAFHGFGVITRLPAHDEVPPLEMAWLAIGNDRTNTLYLIFFESRESNWESAWKIGEPMIHKFSLDDEF